MKSRKFGAVAGIAVVALAATVLAYRFAIPTKKSGPAKSPPIERIVRYGLTVENRTSHVLVSPKFWVYAPMSGNGTQQRTALKASYPYRLADDQNGGQRLVFDLGTLPPNSAKVVRVEATLVLNAAQHHANDKSGANHVNSQPLVESNAAPILRLSKSLVGHDELETATNIYRWVADNIRYDGYSKYDRSALFALKNKRGDCTEFSYLVTALSRAAKLHATSVAGFVVDRDKVLNPRRYHDWSEVMVGDDRYVVDAQRKVFERHDGSYIAFRVTGGSTRTGDDAPSSLYGSDARLIVRMNQPN